MRCAAGSPRGACRPAAACRTPRGWPATRGWAPSRAAFGWPGEHMVVGLEDGRVVEAVIPAREPGLYWRIDYLRHQGVLVDQAGMELSAPAGLEVLDSGGLRLLDAGGAVVFEF